jgi:hypothetical protein
MAASGKDIEAGGAFVRLWMKDDGLKKGLESAARTVASFGKVFLGIGAALSGAGLAILGALGYAAKGAADYGSEIKDAADRTGLGIVELQELKHAAELSGASLEDLEAGMKFMQKGGFGSGAQDVEKWANVIAGMKDPAQQTAKAIEVFGRGGARLIPLLKEGSAGIARLREEARRLGLVMSEEDVNAAEAFGDQLKTAETQARLLKVQIGVALIPTLSTALKQLTELTGGLINFVHKNPEIVTAIAILGVVLTITGAAFIGLGTAALLASAMITVAIHIVNAAIWLFKIMNPEVLLFSVLIGAVALALAGLPVFVGLTLYSLYKLLDSFSEGRALLNALGEALGPFWERFKETWGGIVAAIKKGELGIALRIAWLGLKGEFFRIIEEIHVAWAELLKKVEAMILAFAAKRPEMFGGLLGLLGGGVSAGVAIGGGWAPDPKTVRGGYDQLIGDIDKERRRLIEQMKAPPPERKSPPSIASVLGDAAKGTFSGLGISQALAISDKVSDKIASNTGRTADTLDQIKDRLGGGLPIF